ncbi:hypothetical protein H6F86_10140 [Phormidium sp. FACHB-592]|uniref:hypothetical protein n=1 Tax=Phormidium sp. FACHB-592 TaxID=2692850 RepID=UPI001688D8D0|nr:hypothetical protein [Phormidium sp. FACHB-592]MBD2074242.1 hypothetical protein [Phormidium sp. FACHB-592]
MLDAKLFPLLESSQHLTASHDAKKIGAIRYEFENRTIFRENVQLLTPTAPLSATSSKRLGWLPPGAVVQRRHRVCSRLNWVKLPLYYFILSQNSSTLVQTD